MREAVRELVRLGPLPDQDAATEAQLEAYERELDRLAPPVSAEEARALVGLFGPDDCYGLAWTLLHLVETSDWVPLEDGLAPNGAEWVERLRARAENARRLGLGDGPRGAQ